VILWRIAADTRRFRADDLSGGGAAASPGRWNDAGQAVLYAAPTIAIAMLETAAHVDDSGLPLNKYLLRIDVPEAAWSARQTLDVAGLPVTWAAIPAGSASVKVGSDWFVAGLAPILVVPSVIVPEELAALINPAHRLVAGMTAKVVRLVEYNRLFRAP
jgi:RES domain-containing protein